MNASEEDDEIILDIVNGKDISDKVNKLIRLLETSPDFPPEDDTAFALIAAGVAMARRLGARRLPLMTWIGAVYDDTEFTVLVETVEN